MKSTVLHLAAAAALALTAGVSQASETIRLNPDDPAPQVTPTRPARIENLIGTARCEIALVPNGVLQFAQTCSLWPLVAKSRQWARIGRTLQLSDGAGTVTVTFYETSRDVFITGRADPEFLRLTILPPPAQLKLQPDTPLEP